MSPQTVIDIAASATYWGCYMVTARRLYGHWRIQARSNPKWKHFCKDPNEYHSSCCFGKRENLVPRADGITAVMAMTSALLFPVVWAAVFIRYNPKKSTQEIEAELDRQKTKTAALEKELGL